MRSGRSDAPRKVLQTVGSPTELKTGLSSETAPAATLKDVFRHYAGSDLTEDGATQPAENPFQQKGGSPCQLTKPPRASRPSRLVRAPRGVRRVGGLLRRMGAFALVELQKLSHDRSELLTRMVQPALWLIIVGQTFSRLHVIDTGDVPYLAFLAPGIIAQSARSSQSSTASRSCGTATPGCSRSSLSRPRPRGPHPRQGVRRGHPVDDPGRRRPLLAYLLGVH